MTRPAGRPRARLLRHAACLALACLGLLHRTPPAQADLKVRSPIVGWREFEFEQNGLLTLDRRKSDRNGNQSYTVDLGYGVTPWWRIEVEAETQALAGQNLRLAARTIESTFQLLPQGKYSFDLGLFAEYSNTVIQGGPGTITIGPILQMETAGVLGVPALHTLNAFVEREVGHNRTDRTGVVGAAQSRLLLNPLFEPGVEVFYSVEDLRRPGRIGDQKLYAGPMFGGGYALGAVGLPGKVNYEVGYLFGATTPSARGAVRWRFEYELAF